MAKSYSFVASIGADTSALNNALKEIDTESKQLRSELSQINRALKFDPENTVLAAQRLEVMGDAAKEAEKKLEILKSKQEEMNQALEAGDISVEYYRAYQREIASAESTVRRFSQAQEQANEAQRESKEAAEDNTDAQEDAEKATEQLTDAEEDNAEAAQKAESSTGNWVEVLKGMLASKVVSEIADKLKEFAAAAIEVGESFDSSMSQVAATMGITEDENSEAFNTLKDAAQEMGATTKYTASEAADALNYLALAGYDAKEAVESLPTVLNLAQAGGMDLAAASDMVTDSISALGLAQEDMTEFTDKMAVTSQKSNTSVSQLGEALLTIGGTAKNVKGGVTEINTMLGVLADNGIKGAEGGTALRNVILSLTAPTDAAREALEQLGVSVADDDGNMRELPEIFTDLNAALSEMSGNVDKTEILNEIFNKVDLNSVNALLGTSSERFEELSGCIDDSDGAASKMAETMNDNLEGALASCNSAFEAFEYSVYEKVSEPMKEAAKSIASMLTGITGDMDEEAVREAVNSIGNYVTEVLDNLIPMITEASEELLPILLDSINENLRSVSEAGGNVLLVFIQGIVESLPYLAEGALQIVLGLADSIAANLPNLVPAAVDAVMKISETLIDNIDPLIDAAFSIINALAEGLINSVPVLLEKAPVIITKLIAALTEAIPNVIESAVELCDNIAETLLTYDWKSVGAGVYDKLNEALNNALHGDKNYTENAAKAEAERIERYANLTSQQLDKMIGEAGTKLAELKEAYNPEGGVLEMSALPKWMQFEIDKTGKSISEYLEDQIANTEQLISDLAEARRTAVSETEKNEEELQSSEKELRQEQKEELAEAIRAENETFANNTGIEEITEQYEELAEAEEEARASALEADTAEAKERFDTLIDELENEKITREEFNDEYTGLAEELAEKQIDISEYAADKIADYDEKMREENITAWKRSSEEITDNITEAYENVNKAYEYAKSKYLESAELIDQKVTDATGTDRYVLSDFGEQTRELKQYQKNLEKLKSTGISDELMEEIMNLSYESGDRQGFIKELLRMSDEQRQAYYNDFAEYYAETERAAQNEVRDDLNKADETAKQGIKDIYGSMPEEAYEQGVETAQAYIDGINETMSGADAIRAANLDLAAKERSAASDRETSSIKSIVSQLTDLINRENTSQPMNIYLDGKKVWQGFLNDSIKAIKLSDGRIG